MHDSVRAWIVEHRADLRGPLLEVGSLNVNGSVRNLGPADYIGIDIVEGPSVDLVYGGKWFPFADNRFATVLCLEVFEHCKNPVEMARQIVRVLKPGGHAFVTTRGPGFPHHHPPDRWRFMLGTISELFTDLGCSANEIPDPDYSGMFVEAVKP